MTLRVRYLGPPVNQIILFAADVFQGALENQTNLAIKVYPHIPVSTRVALTRSWGVGYHRNSSCRGDLPHTWQRSEGQQLQRKELARLPRGSNNMNHAVHCNVLYPWVGGLCIFLGQVAPYAFGKNT